MSGDVRSFSNAEVEAYLGWQPLIDALDAAFKQGAESPPRPHFDIGVPGEEAGTLLLMPAWAEGRHIGIKTITVFPGNAARSEPSVNSHYLLMSAMTGRVVATFAADSLTLRRTAAASALASQYLSRPGSKRLLVVGTGGLSPNLAAAHAKVREFEDIAIWGRNTAKAQAVVDTLASQGIPARAASDLRAEAADADVISCCTLSRDPLIMGEWLKPGAHLDLVGAYTPEMREADEIAVTRSRVFVDTFEGALAEAGELVQAMASGALKRAEVQASLFELCRGTHAGRRGEGEITLFKSVGCSLEDLAAAELCVAAAGSR